MTPELRQLNKDLERNESINTFLFLLGAVSLFGLVPYLLSRMIATDFINKNETLGIILIWSLILASFMPFAFSLNKRKKLKAKYNDLENQNKIRVPT